MKDNLVYAHIKIVHNTQRTHDANKSFRYIYPAASRMQANGFRTRKKDRA